MGWGQQRGSGAVTRRSVVAGEMLKASGIVGRGAFLGDEDILGFHIRSGWGLCLVSAAWLFEGIKQTCIFLLGLLLLLWMESFYRFLASIAV